MLHPIVAEERALLARIASLLTVPSADVTPSEQPIVDELVRLRAEMGSAKGEDRGALFEQFHAQVSLLEQLRAGRGRPEVDPASPYFAHIRLREVVGGRTRERDVCLGKATRVEAGMRIVDWRHAPVSKLFYQYRQGERYEEELGGRLVEGEVTARRTVTIREGRLRAIYAPEGVFERTGPAEDDGETGHWRQSSREPPRLAGGAGQALHWHREGAHGRRLGSDPRGGEHRRDKHLPDIAGLIDPDQFELISRPEGFLVIRGSAGSGKTTVALHRIAWLAHADPRINSGRTLFLVFSRALRDYVGHVLPALGVAGVQIQTFRDWAGGLRQRHFPRLPPGHREDTPALVVAFKSHPAALQALRWQVQRTRARSTPTQAVEDWVNATTNPALLAEAVAATAPGAFDEDELQRVATWCRTQYEELLAWRAGRLDPSDDEEEPGGWSAATQGAGPLLDEEDDSLLLHAWQLRVGPLRGSKRRPLRLLHVAIDEVQDFSPVDVQLVLGCLERNQSITLAGDTQQHVMKDAGFTSWSDFFRHLQVEGAAVETLSVSYRCTREVVSFAMGVLGPLREDELPMVARSGPKVELFPFTDHGACVAFLSEALCALFDSEPRASVAILTPSRELSGLYFRGLQRAEVPRLRQVTRQDFAFAPGVEVTEVEEVKGLEFDYVVLVEASAPYYPSTDGARRRLHVGATRAIHQLWLTAVETPSPLIEEARSAG